MRNWKKVIAGAMCLMMLETPAVLTSPAAVMAAEVTAEAEAPVVKEGLQKENGKYYFYENGVMQKNCWKDVTRVSKGKNVTYRYYFSSTGAAYAAAKGQVTLVKKIRGKYYGFNSYGVMAKNAFRIAKVKKGSRTLVYRYYFGSNGAACTGKRVSGTNEIAVKKIGKKYYGFYTNGRMLKGNWVRGSKFYVFNSKTGIYDAAKSKRLRSASAYGKDAAQLRSLLGKPNKTVTADSCYGDGKDLLLYYQNFIVTLFKSSATGKEIVLGVMSR